MDSELELPVPADTGLTLQPEQDSLKLSKDEGKECLELLLSQLDLVIAESETKNRNRMIDIDINNASYIQDFEFIKKDELRNFTNLEFVSPIGALVQRPIDLTNIYWSVQVVNAVSPVNFQVRSYQLLDILDETTTAMNIFYEKYHGDYPQLTFDDLQLQGFYVVKTEIDNNAWARCKIVEPFASNMPIIALLVDSGTLISSAPGNFRLLTTSFSVLPIQAYEASLGGIDGSLENTTTSSNSKKLYTTNICLRFQNRVNGKDFPSVLRGLTFESGDFKPIKLFLADTSSQPDKWIHREFM